MEVPQHQLEEIVERVCQRIIVPAHRSDTLTYRWLVGAMAGFLLLALGAIFSLGTTVQELREIRRGFEMHLDDPTIHKHLREKVIRLEEQQRTRTYPPREFYPLKPAQ